MTLLIVHCDLPHLLQNLAFCGIELPQIMQFFMPDGFGISMSTGLKVGSSCIDGDGMLYWADGPAVPPAFTKPPMPNPACGGGGVAGPPVGLLIEVPFSMAPLISKITRTARKFRADVATR